MSGTLRLSLLIEAIDRASAPLERVQGRIGRLVTHVAAVAAATRRLGDASGARALAVSLGTVAGRARDATSAVAGLAGRLALVGAGAGFAFNRLLVRPAADFQNFTVTLETVMGSAEAAQRRLADLTEFAARTPFSVSEVVSAGVQMQVLGIRGEAADRALRAAGDAAAVFPGARLADTIGALGAAMRGELDPLERFGIQAQTVGDRLVLRWERNGRLIEESVNKTNRRAIAASIARAWGDVAPSGMERRAGTWDGMLSNLGDAWENFRRRVAQSGPFDWLQGQLRELLALTSRLEADGTLQRWAETAGAAITRVFGALRDFVVGTDETPGVIARLQAVFERLSRVIGPIVDRFGGLETFLVAIGLVLAGPLIGALVSLTGAMAALGLVLALTPAGWFALAATGVAALGVAIYQNWDGIIALFRRIGDEWRRFADSEQIMLLRDAFGAAADWISQRWGEVSAAFTGFGDNVRRTLSDIAGYFQPLIDAVNWLLDSLPSLGGGGGQAGPTPRQRGAGNALRRQSIYGPDALPGSADGGGVLPPANDVRVSAGLDVNIRAPEGFGVSVTPRGADEGLALNVRRGTMATP